MERKIGEIFEYQGEWYQCVKDDYPFNCWDCCFYNRRDKKCSGKLTGYCSSGYRSDGKEIIYKKLEKVGEPITYMNRTYQRLKSLDDNTCKYCYLKNQVCNPQLCGEAFFLVGIKKVVEDMGEENDIKPYDKYFSNGTVSNTDNLPKSNLKPFDLEAAKAGKPVCTRDGRKARIICFDAKGDKPIIALVEAKGNKDALIEEVERYFINGHSVFEVRGTNNDLMMLPEKKEGWVNIYKTGNDKFAALVGSDYLYKTEKEAKIEADPRFLATVKIEWEE